MHSQNQSTNSIQEGLRLMNQCPVCKNQYQKQQTTIVEEKQGASMVHKSCPHCHNSILAVVAATQVGMSSVGMLTDLSREDVGRLQPLGRISEDELLYFHKFLNAKQFNFKF